ncbi:GNAT family N-acetyltransferase [Ruegeria sp. 2012CJ41-6]|uniref:GNAT family N-acetyltransferase n=1 Tax=Ruegeria spongiae TaxID=2942209 RepID=A0ABT0Q496_9RHOB|nr:GNAT family N-acetyltransferase [Ruegeria spongiae]MCL6284695.1 GNAT family N-acetyltransferase [Ruegeria spongiae]
MTIRTLRQGEHEIIGKITGAAFADDPVYDFLMGSQAAIIAYTTFMAKKLYLERGFGHIAEDNSAGSLWLPAGVSGHLSFLQTLPITPALIRHCGLRRVLRALPAGDEFDRHKPKHPFFYLFVIGVLTEGRGKGLGGKLMEAGLEMADQAGMPVYLENSKEENMRFYQRYGFEQIGECYPVPGCPVERLMLRPAQ